MLDEPYKVNGISRTWGEHIVELVNGPKNVDLLDTTCNNLKSHLVRGVKLSSNKFLNSNIAECADAYIQKNVPRMEKLVHEVILNNENVVKFGFSQHSNHLSK